MTLGIKVGVNQEVNTNIIDYVSNKVVEVTGQNWTNLISAKDLNTKIAWIFNRKKAESKMTPIDKMKTKKASIRKSRRVTVSYLQS